MNSNNGDLYFEAGIDDSKFNVSADAMEERIKKMTATVQEESADMENSIQSFAKKGAEYIATYLVGKGMFDLTKSFVTIRGEFQQLEIAFETMLGSAEKANALMGQLTTTAAKTPFDLQGVANGAKQLLAYGTAAEDVNDVLIHLGDIASGLSIPLNDLVMLYGTTMTQGRMFTQDLRQFMGRGIPLAEELAKQFGVTKDKVGELVTAGKVTSKEFNAALMAMSSEGGKFYNLMEKQSASLTGKISNFEDAWTVARNNIGQSMEGVASDAISMATSVVENLEPIMKTVRAVAIAYGSYRAALMLNSLATKGETGVALIDNTVKKAKVQLLRMEEKATSGTAERIKELKRARQEEVASLESQLSAEERLNILHQARIANIGQQLTATQKLELRNLGLTEASEDYERVALSMMSNEQRLAVERGELTNNTADYIASLRDAVDAKNLNISTIDEEIAKTQEDLKFSIDYRNMVQEQVAASRERCKSLENEVSNLDLFGNSEEAAAKATEWKTEKTKLATLEEELNTAATAVNEKQTNLETLAKQRNAAATVGSAAADKAGATAKTLFARATTKARIAISGLWKVIRANPIGFIVTAIGLVVSALSIFKSKSEEAEEKTGTLAVATKKASEEFDKEKAKIDSLNAIVHNSNVSLDERKRKLEELKGIVPGYHASLTEEGRLIDDNTESIKTYCAELEKQIRLKAAQEELEEAYKAKRQAEKTRKTAQSEYDREVEISRQNQESGIYGAGETGALMGLGDAQRLNRARKDVQAADREIMAAEKNIKELTDEIQAASMAATETVKETVTVSERRRQLVRQIAQTEKEIAEASRPNAAYDEKKLKAKQDELKALQQELQTLNGGVTQKQMNSRLENEQKATEKLIEMQAEGQRAEIEAMEDGYEKRMAQLEYERQQELAQIDKDAKELKEARKKAGMSATLTEEEEKNLETRRAAVNQRFGNSRAELAEEEIRTMREKYREYEKWVEVVGQNAADKHFKGLREAGENFSDWVQRQIAALEARKNQAPADFNSGDERALGAFKDAQPGSDELNYYDNLKRAIDGSISSASNLTKKIKELKEAIDKIKKDPKLTDEQKAALGLEFAEQLIAAEDENQRRFEETYKAYSQTRREVVAQYQADIDKLIASGQTYQAEQLKAEMKRAMGNLDENFLKGLFSEVFSGKATAKAVKAAVSDLNKMKGMDLVTFNSTYNTDFTIEELEELKAKIDAVNSSLKDMGGYSIADAFKDIRDGRIENDLERVARGTNFLQTAFSNFVSVVNELSSALTELAEASDNENLQNTARTVSRVSSVLGSAGQWAGMGANIGGGWGAVIGAVLGGGLGIVAEILQSDADKQTRMAASAEEGLNFQKETVNQLVNILGSVQSLSETVTSLNYDQYRTQLSELISELRKSRDSYYQDTDGKSYWEQIYNAVLGSSLNGISSVVQSLGLTDGSNLNGIWKGLIDAGLISREEAERRNGSVLQNSLAEDWSSAANNWFFGWLDDLMGDERTHTYHIDEDAYRQGTAESVANYINWMAGQFAKRTDDLIAELEALYASHSYNSLDYFNKENDVYRSQLNNLRFQQQWLEALGQTDTDAYRDLIATIAQLEHQMSESMKNMAEGLYGTDMLSIIESWIAIFDEFGDDVEGAFAKIDEGIDKMIANMLQKRLVVEPMLAYFDSIFDSYRDEEGNIDEDDFIEIARRIGDAKRDFRQRYEAYLDALEEADISFDNLLGDPGTMVGAAQNLSEETGGVLAGRLNAVVINQGEETSVLRQSLLVQIETRNTLLEVAADVRYMRNRMGETATPNPYLHQGII